MIDVRPNHLHVPCHMGGSPLLGMRMTGFAIVVFVALYVGFVLEVQAVLVGKVVEVRIVAVVREADMVDVASFHQHHLLFHLLASDGVASRRIRLMTVHALQLHGLSVDIEVATGQAELIVARLSYRESRRCGCRSRSRCSPAAGLSCPSALPQGRSGRGAQHSRGNGFAMLTKV